MDKLKKIGFIINGKAKKVKTLKVDILELFGEYETTILETTFAGQAIDFAENITNNDFNYIISVGGDGTINEVVNGCMRAEIEKREKVIVGVLPFGSGNDFSRSLGINDDIYLLKELITNNCFCKIDIGNITFQTKNAVTESRYFINITDIGIGGEAVEKLNNYSSKIGPKISYHLSILQSFFTYKRVEVELLSENLEWKGETLSICMANGNYFANGMCIAPQANLIDGMFQLVIMGKVSVLDYLKNLAKIKKGFNVDHPEVFYHKIAECTINAQENTCPIDMDGEFIGYAPLKLSIVEKGLNFLNKKYN